MSDHDLAALAGTWWLDPTASAIKFRTRTMWILPVTGTAKATAGVAEIGGDGAVEGTLAIDSSSFDTKNKKRDAHLRSEDFLDVARHPTITFSTVKVTPVAGNRVRVDGLLTIRGRSCALTVEADLTVSNGSAVVKTKIGVDRSLWGLSWAKFGASVKNTVEVSAHFTKYQVTTPDAEDSDHAH